MVELPYTCAHLLLDTVTCMHKHILALAGIADVYTKIKSGIQEI